MSRSRRASRAVPRDTRSRRTCLGSWIDFISPIQGGATPLYPEPRLLGSLRCFERYELQLGHKGEDSRTKDFTKKTQKPNSKDNHTDQETTEKRFWRPCIGNKVDPEMGGDIEKGLKDSREKAV